MDTVVCPKCGTENPANAMNCKHCRIYLQFAYLQFANEHPDQIESPKVEDSTQQAVSKIALALLLLLGCFILGFFSMLMLSPPVFGPCAFGGIHYDTYLAIVNYWMLHLVLGYFVVVARIFVGTQSRNKGTVIFGHFLTVAIVVWIVVAIWIWNHIFSRLCV